MPTNTYNRLLKNDVPRIRSGSNQIHYTSRITTSNRNKSLISRIESPTLECLTAVRTKLDKYVASELKIISLSQQSFDTMHEVSLSPNHEKSRRSSSLSQNEAQAKKELISRPVDKVTYEETGTTQSGSSKLKCSLEIWLPNAYADTDDEITSRTISPDSTVIQRLSQSIMIQSHRSSPSKTSTVIENIIRKSFDDASSTIIESAVTTHVDHTLNYIEDQSEQPLPPNKSSTSSTIKPNKTTKRSHTHRPPPSTNFTKKRGSDSTTKMSLTSKNLLPNIEQPYSTYKTKGSFTSSNSTMINVPMRKYSKKKTNKKSTEVKVPAETKLPHEKKDSTSCVSSNQPKIAIRILLGTASSYRSANKYRNINTKIFNHRLLNNESPNWDSLPQPDVISIIDHLQHRRTFTSKATVPLGEVTSKDLIHSLQSKLPTRPPFQSVNSDSVSDSSYLLQSTKNETAQLPPYISKRSVLPPSSLTLHSAKKRSIQPSLQLIECKNSAKKSFITVPTNKLHVCFKYSKGGNYLIP